jgi:hypothetical protein
VFVHDFVTIELPLAQALSTVAQVLLRDCTTFAIKAWSADIDIWTEAGLARADLDPSGLEVHLGPPRVRANAAVMHLDWTSHGGRLVPTLDADLELAAHGPDRCDLQILGRYQFGSDPPRSAVEASLAHRAIVSAVRGLLVAVAHESLRSRYGVEGSVRRSVES